MNGIKTALRQMIGKDFAALETYEELDSTNSEAKRRACAGNLGPILIVAAQQSAGRGRMGRSFFSPAESGAYFSFLYTPKGNLCDAVTVTSAASVAVMRAIRRVTGKQTDIKWVNDLYLHGKKVCGILAESVLQADLPARLILGIGINLTTEDFPSEIAESAGALGLEADLRAPLIAAVWQELKPFLEDPTRRDWIADYRRHSAVIGRPIRWGSDGDFRHGDAIGIDADGGLIVRDGEGNTTVLRTGEISVRVE